jgi:hypothetical protein
MNYTDDIGLAISILTLCVVFFILLVLILLRDIFSDIDTDLIKKFMAFIPRQIIKVFKIKHKHHYVCTSCGDGGLAGDVAFYECIWCGDTYVQ